MSSFPIMRRCRLAFTREKGARFNSTMNATSVYCQPENFSHAQQNNRSNDVRADIDRVQKSRVKDARTEHGESYNINRSIKMITFDLEQQLLVETFVFFKWQSAKITLRIRVKGYF